MPFHQISLTSEKLWFFGKRKFLLNFQLKAEELFEEYEFLQPDKKEIRVSFFNDFVLNFLELSEVSKLLAGLDLSKPTSLINISGEREEFFLLKGVSQQLSQPFVEELEELDKDILVSQIATYPSSAYRTQEEKERSSESKEPHYEIVPLAIGFESVFDTFLEDQSIQFKFIPKSSEHFGSNPIGSTSKNFLEYVSEKSKRSSELLDANKAKSSEYFWQELHFAINFFKKRSFGIGLAPVIETTFVLRIDKNLLKVQVELKAKDLNGFLEKLNDFEMLSEVLKLIKRSCHSFSYSELESFIKSDT